MRTSMKMIKRVFSILLAAVMVFALTPAVPAHATIAPGSGYVDVVFSGDQAPFTVDAAFMPAYGLSGTTVKILLDGVTIESATPNVSGIEITSPYTVDLYFRGNCTITGCAISDQHNSSAGIEVNTGATLNIYGENGANLNVTGGNYSAGIGGAGYGDASAGNSEAGKINIYSGNIIARGGDRGAGIGSGYHQSASEINIYGGNITAIGSVGGAGIGSGYGTSGGPGVSGIGFYNGGTINIHGGVVRATADETIDFDGLDIYDMSTFTGSLNTYAAGIGGGYGAASGDITIDGDADVIAIGSSGGAGIGSGRGTNRTSHYDVSCIPCNITIAGISTVIALAEKDHRTGQRPVAGAGIGGGYGFGLEGGTIGNISILDHATVFAHTAEFADGIGSGMPVKSFGSGTGDAEEIRAQMQQHYDLRARANITYGDYVDVRSFVEGTEVFTTRHIVNAVNATVSGDIYRVNGDTVTVTAIVPAGKVFERWQSDEVSFADESAEVTTFTMIGDNVTVSALLGDVASSPSSSHSRRVQEPEIVEPIEEDETTVTFDDISGNEWFAEAVAWVAKNGIMTGMGDGEFMPLALANRAQIAQILFNMDGAKQSTGTATFRDVRPGDWYAKSVAWLVESAIAKGYGESFGALENVSREQLAVMLYNYAALKGYDTSAKAELSTFGDNVSISPWAKDALSWAVGTGIISGTSYGYGNTILDPQGSATRAQIAVMIERFCEKVKK